jgi:hypothetical protein
MLADFVAGEWGFYTASLAIMPTLEEIAALVQADGRASGNVQLLHSSSLHLVASETATDIANRLVQGFGFHAIDPRSWSQLDGAAASGVAQRLLNEDLAYKSELLPGKTASYYADQLIAGLSPYKARFFCNAEFSGSSVQWDPIGDATFEIALVGFDEDAGFLLYAHAED